MPAGGEPVRCPRCGAGPGRHSVLYDRGAATGLFECEVCRERHTGSSKEAVLFADLITFLRGGRITEAAVVERAITRLRSDTSEGRRSAHG